MALVSAGLVRGLAWCGLMGAAAAGAAVPAGNHVRSLTPVEVAYLTSCGGCHGVDGTSAPQAVPTLRHLTGRFLCTREGRQFIVRIPDVALSTLSDRMLTRVMNWVVFDLGAPAAAGREGRPYTVAEVARLRREPLTQTGLTPYRERVVARIEARCAAAAGLGVYGGAYGAGVNSPTPKS
jgi:Cytochrome c